MKIDHLHPLSGADEEVNVISQQLVTDIHDEGDCLILHEWTLLKVKTKDLHVVFSFGFVGSNTTVSF